MKVLDSLGGETEIFTASGGYRMETQKFELFQQIEGKGLTVSAVAEKIGFDPELLKLYFAQDAYPVPKRILDKISQALSN